LSLNADEFQANPAVPQDSERAMKKHFLKMTRQERDAEAKKWERGISFDDTAPMSKRSKALWDLAKRGRGRPKKPAGEKARRVLLSIDPKLLAHAEAFASLNKLDRSKLFSLSVQAYIASAPSQKKGGPTS
jgi:hypothetical protein